MTICTFAGHRETWGYNIENQICAAIENILTTDSEFVFYSGDAGEFDEKCAAAVYSAKRKHPELNIKIIAVFPYMMNRINTNRDYYEKYFDNIIVPEELNGVHYKAAIGQRNRWFVDHCNYLIAYVYRDFGGAYTTLKYVIRQEKKIINLADICNNSFASPIR